MIVLAGTSGYSYDEWRGTFYPEGLKKDGMLAYYGSRLTTVEVNNTFYRMPKANVVEKWRGEVPEGFRFVLKASRRITHMARLKNCEDSVKFLHDVAGVLGDKLGVVLYQLPPVTKKDVPLLEAFLEILPEDRRAAFEFRHASWFEDDVYEALRRHGAALVGGDVDEAGKSPPLVPTAPFGYLRLRRSDYTDAELEEWFVKITAQPWETVYAFFKHELKGPELAGWLQRRAG